MAKKPYSQFFWSDHDNDVNLASCHLFAQGVWMKMLAIMAQVHPRGYLKIEPRPTEPAPVATKKRASGTARGGADGAPRGTPPALADGVPHGVEPALASGVLQNGYNLPPNGSLEHLIHGRIGCTKELYQWAVAHLEEHGVFSRTDDGVIFSRRMVREEENHRKRVERAKTAYDKRFRQRTRGAQPPPGAEPGGTPRGAPSRTPPGVPVGTPHGRAQNTAAGQAAGGAGGVPRGPAITTTNRLNTPPSPPSVRGGESDARRRALEIAARRKANTP